MIERVRKEAEREGLGNAEFSLGDAIGLGFEDAGFDGALTRVSPHHIPVPGRVLEEMARVVRPGGWVIFRVLGEGADRRLALRISLSRWIRP